MTPKLKVAYTEKYLDWQLAEEHEVNPLRAHLAVELLKSSAVLPLEVLESWAGAGEMQRSRWLAGAKRAQGAAAEDLVAGDLGAQVLTMFGGTFTLVEELIRDRALDSVVNVYFNPAGGENSAHKDVEVLNDAAYAVLRLSDAGLRVAYVDLDAHHAYDTEQLLRDREDLTTISIHDRETAGTSYSGDGFRNYSLGAGGGDLGLLEGIDWVVKELKQLDLDVLVLGAGADGLSSDKSSSLEYTREGLAVAALHLGDWAAEQNASVLVLGGGGQLPLDETPEVWHAIVGFVLNGLLMKELIPGG